VNAFMNIATPRVLTLARAASRGRQIAGGGRGWKTRRDTGRAGDAWEI